MHLIARLTLSVCLILVLIPTPAYADKPSNGERIENINKNR